MAVLSDADRFDVWAEYMRENTEVLGALSKGDIRAFINAVDTFLNDNATALNNAIPQPARSVLTVSQKALGLTAVVRKRYIKGA
jgi:hypothetical protein